MENNNNFQNDFSGFQPEKPFTDKSNPNVQLPQNFGQQSAEQFEQISDDQFFEQAPVNASDDISDQQPYQPAPPQNVYTDYSNPVYQGTPAPFDLKEAYASYNQVEQPVKKPQNDYPRYQTPPVYPQNQYNQPPVPPQANPQHNFQPNPQQVNQQPYPQYSYPRYNNYPHPPMPVQQKKSSNTWLIVLVCVLSVLLIISFSGICILMASNNESNNNSKPNHSYTIPKHDDDNSQNNAPSHDESDYSDKIDSSFEGIKLESKPKKSDKNYTAETAFESVSDSVVGVVCYENEVTSVEMCDSQGSGIILTSDGYVVTNAHVIGNSKTAYIIQIITADEKTYDAGVVGFDSRTDIAVLKIDGAKNLKAAKFGDSDEIELGEDIIVIGNPGGLDYQNSITKGIVSAVDRELSATSLVKYIQTDAAINPGNSGGPIVNLYGQVIGIATSKIVSEHYEGMGFAIPSTTAKDIIDDLIQKGYVDGRVKIGITGTAVTATESYGYTLPAGILVTEITKGGPCDSTPLKVGDIITEADGQEVSSFADIYEILESHEEGDKISLTFYSAKEESYTDTEIILQADK